MERKISSSARKTQKSAFKLLDLSLQSPEMTKITVNINRLFSRQLITSLDLFTNLSVCLAGCPSDCSSSVLIFCLTILYSTEVRMKPN